MARLNQPPKNACLRDLRDKDKIQDALQWLRANPGEKPTAAARIYGIKNEQYFRLAWNRDKKKRERGPVKLGGQNRILNDAQHQALIRYAIDQATDGGMGAIKRMMYNAAAYFRRQQGKEPPTKRWFQLWLKDATELHTIKTKPIARHRVDMHTEEDLRQWFEKQYVPALQHTGIDQQEHPSAWIHNMDEKGCRIACPAGEDVVVPVGIDEMYVGIPENRLSLTVIESICADGTAISPVVIIPGGSIMESWFHKNMTGHELITVSSTGYTNTKTPVITAVSAK
jgi:hypothetical protein